jgi:hypothetical protein
MKIIIESTDKIVELATRAGASMPARLWEGTTEDGVPVYCFITRIATDKGPGEAQFQKELQKSKNPKMELPALSMRYFID